MTSVVRITSVGDSDPHAIVDHQISNLAPDLNPFIHPRLAQNTCAHSGEVAHVFFLVKTNGLKNLKSPESRVGIAHPTFYFLVCSLSFNPSTAARSKSFSICFT